MKIRLLFFSYLFLPFAMVQAQVQHLEIAAIQTDPMIDLDLLGGDTIFHQVFVGSSISLKDKLMVFLPGTNGRPGAHYSKFCQTAAQEGYHTIGLTYKNTVSISGLCGTNATTDEDCSEEARMEIIYGTDLSNGVAVDSTNSIINRLIKLLTYLQDHYPQAGWDSFLNEESSGLNWVNIAFAGHSQGGGHAALIARDHVVNRVLFFNCPSDRNNNIQTPLHQPPWFYDAHITPDSAYYAFYHQQNGGPQRLTIYQLFGLDNFGDEVNADISSWPYEQSHILYTDTLTFDFSGFENPACNNMPFNPHSDIIVDCEIPFDNFGNNPYKKVWEYMLSHTEAITDEAEAIHSIYPPRAFPNPTSGLLFFQKENSIIKVDVYSSNGQLVRCFKDIAAIDFRNFQDGLYILKIFHPNGISQQKIIKI